MPFLVLCKGSGATAMVDCTCPPELKNAPIHHPQCVMTDLDAALSCPPGSGCCTDDHDGLSHGASASTCAGGHGACPNPDSCELWYHATAGSRHPLYDGPPPGPCPGGHCGKDVDGCKVCHPLTIIAPPGSATVVAVAGG